tara:strand:+ start:571 stop:912 length:342 start_codon:yes stop_codon:yes gene_type:complete
MAQIEELFIEQNSSFEYMVEIDNNVGGDFDLTSYIAKAQLRRSYKTSSKIDFGVSYFGNPSLGKIKVALTPTQTGALKHGSYVWDIIVEGAGGDAYRIVEGVAYVEPGVTALS